MDAKKTTADDFAKALGGAIAGSNARFDRLEQNCHKNAEELVAALDNLNAALDNLNAALDNLKRRIT